MRQHSKNRRLLAIFLGFSVLTALAACGDDDDGEDGGGGGGGEEEAACEEGAGKRIYFVDGNLSNTAAEVFTERCALNGIRGTFPSAEIGAEFRDRLHEHDPELEDELYGPESYDAVTVLALAATQAGTDRPDEVARNINAVTRDGTECTSFEECVGLIEDGEDIDYNGVSGPLDFGQPGEPTAGTYAIQTYGPNNELDPELTEYRDITLEDVIDPEAEEVDPAVAALQETGDANPTCTGEEDGVLQLGGLLPTTGDLSFLGPPMIAGSELAVEDINAAGGVNGQDVEFVNEDSGDAEPSIAPAAVDQHLQRGVDAFVGAAASGISLNVIDRVIAECKIQFSPSNTSAEFTTYEDDDLYFRTAPADVLQGGVLANLALEEGGGTAVILSRQDSYGEGLASYIEIPFTLGGGEILDRRPYDPEAQEFSAEVQAVVDNDPDILFMVGFNESYRIIEDLLEQNFTP